MPLTAESVQAHLTRLQQLQREVLAQARKIEGAIEITQQLLLEAQTPAPTEAAPLALVEKGA